MAFPKKDYIEDSIHLRPYMPISENPFTLMV
jgi:hypothetical protein